MRNHFAIVIGVGLGCGLLFTGCASVCPMVTLEERNAFREVRPEQSGYVLATGDQMQVEVYQNQQLTRQVTVRPDGQITLPLVNDVPAAGLTVTQFRDKLADRLKAYVRDPVVSVLVTHFSTKQIYIQGQVRQPAAFTYRGEMHILQAVALAGGVNPFAEGCAIVVRQKDAGFLRYTVPLQPLLDGDNLSENISLLPNDVVTVH